MIIVLMFPLAGCADGVEPSEPPAGSDQDVSFDVIARNVGERALDVRLMVNVTSGEPLVDEAMTIDPQMERQWNLSVGHPRQYSLWIEWSVDGEGVPGATDSRYETHHRFRFNSSECDNGTSFGAIYEARYYTFADHPAGWLVTQGLDSHGSVRLCEG